MPAEADFVCYWIAKAWLYIREDAKRRAGLVTTNSVRAGASRKVLEPAAAAGAIHEAWSDEPWTLDGAAVRVSMIVFGRSLQDYLLDGIKVLQINSNITSAARDFSNVKILNDNLNVAFQGPVKVGAFDIDGQAARLMLTAPTNPNGRRNSDVILPLVAGGDIVRRSKDRWVIDFGNLSEAQAELYEAPFRHVLVHVKPIRDRNADRQRREKWWLLGRSGGGWKTKSVSYDRVIVTSRVAKHRLFRWQSGKFLPDSRVCAVASSDDITFGTLSSKIHELWSLATCSWHGVGNDPTYNSESCFETFPFWENFSLQSSSCNSADHFAADRIVEATLKLNSLREAWLNPPDFIRIEPEVVPGYPDRILPKDEAAAETLKKRTLTNLYNERPTWLANAHRALDEAVAAAYGWPADLSDDEILARLFALNQERAAAGR